MVLSEAGWRVLWHVAALAGLRQQWLLGGANEESGGQQREGSGMCRCLRSVPQHSCAGTPRCAKAARGLRLQPSKLCGERKERLSQAKPGCAEVGTDRVSGSPISLGGGSQLLPPGERLERLALPISGATVLAPVNTYSASNPAFSPRLSALTSLSSHYPAGLLSRAVFKQATKLELSPPSQLFQPGNDAERLFCLCSVLHRGETQPVSFHVFEDSEDILTSCFVLEKTDKLGKGRY